MTVKDKDGKAIQVPAERNPYGFYNNVPYDDRGWPTFETGCASAVEAHLYKNKNQGTPYNGDFDAAEEYQPKLTDISKGPDGTGKRKSYESPKPWKKCSMKCMPSWMLQRSLAKVTRKWSRICSKTIIIR